LRADISCLDQEPAICRTPSPAAIIKKNKSAPPRNACTDFVLRFFVTLFVNEIRANPGACKSRGFPKMCERISPRPAAVPIVRRSEAPESVLAQCRGKTTVRDQPASDIPQRTSIVPPFLDSPPPPFMMALYCLINFLTYD
jgi:hypothetical protein